MSKQRAQVFIATTKGLVQIESISPLSDSESNSVVTIGNTSQLAGISHLYQNFVDKPQGIVNTIFNGRAFRLNLSKGIDQGESWQLGVFIAHYLFEHDCFSAGANPFFDSAADAVGSPDIIFIATGRVDTLHYQVLEIDELTKKCLHANPYIANWQASQRQLCFIAPAQNLREPIPNSLIRLTPIRYLKELEQLCLLYKLPVQALSFPDFLDVIDKQHGITFKNSINKHNEVIVEAAIVDVKTTDKHFDIDKIEEQTDSHKPYKKGLRGGNVMTRFFTKSKVDKKSLPRFLLIIASMLALLIAISQFLLSEKGEQSEGQHEFIILGEISENTASCLSADSSMLDQGTFGVKEKANTTNLSNLCQLSVVTSSQINGLWLVSDTKAIIELNDVEIKQEALTKKHLLNQRTMLLQQANLKMWAVPLPQYRGQSRKFTLLAFAHLPDQADKSSLDRFLLQLYEQGIEHQGLDLQNWISKTQGNNKVLMLEQELAIYQ